MKNPVLQETGDSPSTRLPHNLAEFLETAWTLEELGQACLEDIVRTTGTEVSDELLSELKESDLISIERDKHVRLLSEGRRQAIQIIRRHRLAERLICDALGQRVEDAEDAACEFEHLIAEGITSSICTLLGHPRFCPHNKPIPEGDCCRQAREELGPIVTSSDLLELGGRARVAYIAAREHGLVQKLAALGISPGVQIKLLQKWPSFVFQCEETEVAVEAAVARDIYIWQRDSHHCPRRIWGQW